MKKAFVSSLSLICVVLLASISPTYGGTTTPPCGVGPAPGVQKVNIENGKLQLSVPSFQAGAQKVRWEDSRNPGVVLEEPYSYKLFNLVPNEPAFTITVWLYELCDDNGNGIADPGETWYESHPAYYNQSCGIYPAIGANFLDHTPIANGQTNLYVDESFTGVYDEIRWYRVSPSDGLSTTPMGVGNNLTVPVDMVDVSNNTFQVRTLKDCGGLAMEEGTGTNLVLDLNDQLIPVNHVTAHTYDDQGNVQGTIRTYFDNNGGQTQTLTVDPITNHVYAQQHVRDELGRPMLSTPATPVSANPPSEAAALEYRPDFVKAQDGTTYNHTHFDNLSGSASPAALSNQEGTLGWFYSNQNTLVEAGGLAPTARPYGVADHYDDGLGETRRQAGATDTYTLGSGHESTSASIPVTAELDFYLQVRAAILPQTQTPTTLKNKAKVQWGRDANGVAGIVISDARGEALMSAQAGNWIPNLELHQVQPAAGLGSEPALSRMRVYTLAASDQLEVGSALTASATQVDLQYDNNTVTTGSALPLASAPLNYVGVLDIKGDDRIYTKSKVSFGNIAYNFYDDRGRLVASVTPLGVYELLQLPDLSSITSPADLPYATTYTYDFEGRVLSVSEPDAGTVTYQYRKDGLLRFSQNQEQAARNAFSYINYDHQQRAVASGEFVGSTPTYATLNSLQLEAVDELGGLPISFNPADPDYSNHRDWMRTVYDKYQGAAPMASVPWVEQDLVIDYPITEVGHVLKESRNSIDLLPGMEYDPGNANNSLLLEPKLDFVQEWTEGAVAYTENEHSQTWYSYDDRGNLAWLIQLYKDKNFDKYLTLEYTYDFYGNTTQVVYNRGQADAFYHHYTYDIKSRLVKAETSRDGMTKTEHASYSYFFHGPLKRMVLGGDLQGLDYTYTTNGALKAVNQPLHPDQDPDFGLPAGGGNDIPDDVFSFGFDYYSGDYNGTDIPGISGKTYGDQYAGLPNTFYWNTHSYPDGFVSPDPAQNGKARGYNLAYDQQYQMTTGEFGWISQAGTYTSTTQYKESLSYDANGNILSLDRTNHAGALMDDLSYQYTQGRNQLELVTNSGTASSEYAMASTTYTYDELGRLDTETDGTYTRQLLYTVEGLVAGVNDITDPQAVLPVVRYTYNELGHRIRTQLYDQQGALSKTTFYVYDLSGSLMAIYEQEGAATELRQIEVPVYGASRLGIAKVGYDTLGQRTADQVWYQLSDHLGNVRAVLTKLDHDTDPLTDPIPTVLEVQDYYPFGRVNPWYSHGSDYRFGYQGEYSEELFEEDQDGDNTAGWNAFMLRMYDARIGRWLSVDPARQFSSPYKAMGNLPLSGSDPDGAFTWLGAFVRNGFSSDGLIDLGGGDWGVAQSSVGYAPSFDGKKTVMTPVTSWYSEDGLSNIYDGAVAGLNSTYHGIIDPFTSWEAFGNHVRNSLFHYDLIIWGLDIYEEYNLWDNGLPEINISTGDIYFGVGYGLEKVAEIVILRKAGTISLRYAARTGMSEVQLVTRAAQKAEAAIGGTGRFAGTAKHTYANNLLSRYQSIYGNRGLQFNNYFNNGVGNRGFLDVVNHNSRTIYDFKFGSATWRAGQLQKYQRNFPGYNIQIIRP